MKVIQTPVRFYPAVGGVEKYVLDLSVKLTERGIGVKVLCANDPHSNLKQYKNIIIDRLGYFIKVANTNLSLTFPFRLWREDFDIIHTHLPTPWFADWSAIIGRLKRKKVILTYHNDIVGRGLGSVFAKIYNNTILKLTLSLVDKIIITQPKYLKYSVYLKKFKSKVEIVPNGVDLEKFKPLPNIEKQKNTLFFLSVLDQYHKYKGLDYLLETVESVAKEIPTVKLIVGGKGKMLDYYKNKVKEMGIQKNVKFHGYIPDDRLAEYYNKYEIFILPSTDSSREGFGIVLLEALACGSPVITTNIVGVADEIKRCNAGLVIELKEIKELKGAVITILKDKGIYTNNALAIVKKFDSKAVANKILTIYNSLVV